MNFLNPEFQIIRDKDRCIKCGACVRQCSYEVHVSDKDTGELYTNDINCVACHRCTSICPTRTLTVKKNESAYREAPTGYSTISTRYSARPKREGFAVRNVKPAAVPDLLG